ncbi:MerR family transcriptional regulator [Lacticaseibacillus absianus]|uniref:MerR family transcriptional regulator n=1 Tax=Lacticaseibacillus absianus TaxID=2729623 RepID=UPI0015C7A5D4|nr:MerR family transcriptional regulator [Lacticaseibacillus absianus]
MLIGEFITAHQTTKETVRFYVQRGLMHPARRGRNYWYTAADAADFEAIRALQAMGFSIAAILEIRARHDSNCGTLAQWQANVQLVDRELKSIDEQLATLAVRQGQLRDVRAELATRIARAAQEFPGNNGTSRARPVVSRFLAPPILWWHNFDPFQIILAHRAPLWRISR